MWEELIGGGSNLPDRRTLAEVRAAALPHRREAEGDNDNSPPLTYAEAEAVLLEGHLRKGLVPKLTTR